MLITLGEEPPAWLSVPIIAQSPEPAQRAASGLIQPTIDGVADAGEWDAAGTYSVEAGALAANLPLERLYYGFDAHTLYLRVDAAYSWGALTTCGGNPNCRTTVGIYLMPPGGGEASAFSCYGGVETYLGFGATRLLEHDFAPNAQLTGATWSTFDGERWIPSGDFPVEELRIAIEGATLEVSIPLGMLAPEGAALDSGDRILLRLVLSQGTMEQQADSMLLPASGPALLTVPDLGLTTPVLVVEDPPNDDHGPGSYTYPTDAVFQPGVFDATSFSVGYDDTYIVFRLTLRGPLENVWNSPNGISVQTVDVYIDKDGPGAGARLLLPGRNAALTADHAWDYAIWVEGWTPGIYVPGDAGPVQIDAEMVVIADPGQSKITVKVPRAVLGDDPENWAYAVVVLGQEGYPASGVWRVRDVNPRAEQWRFGGGPNDANHTRIIDMVWPAGMSPSQEEMLSAYVPSQEPPASLGPDAFVQLETLPRGP